MRDRLAILWSLLSENGALWISVDDNEFHYLKVLCDELFGRSNFVASVIWQKTLSVKNSARHFSVDHDYILVYARNAESWRPNPVAASEKQRATYKNPDNDPRGAWQSISLSARNYYSKGTYAITCPGGREIAGPPEGRYWSVSEDKFWAMHEAGEIWWGKNNNGVPRRKMYLADRGELTKAPQTLWFFEDVGHTQDAKKEALALNSEDVFGTPKPEMLMKRIIDIATDPGDLVLDSFAGSGTTGAVAHKMRRRWVMVELGQHCQSHIVPRLRQVIEGQDEGGATKEVSWQGGGGFRFFSLAPSLLESDRWGNWIVSRDYNAAMLAEAVCKLEGFSYSPDSETFWIHGRSTERDFIYVTTQNLSRAQLQFISEEVGDDRTLLICCGSFRVKRDAFSNLTLKKIPQAVLHRCEWGRDDYSLNVEALPAAEDAGENSEARPAQAKSRKKAARGNRKKKDRRGMHQLPLFDGKKQAEGGE
jgi:adenine-specific DNA-methyltransferase